MTDSLDRWLRGLGLGEYAATFAEHAIDEDVLSELTEADLEKVGVKLGHRKKLLRAIAALDDGSSTAPESPSDRPAGPARELDEHLAAWERHPGERKPVTMLFADITGSTALTERLDAEEAHDVLYGATQRMCAAVENNRGTLCRFMGDGVMAMFGAPLASEQHALDAAMAALEMQDAVRDYSRRIEDRHGSALQIRVGLHSGEVVVLTVGEGEHLEYDASGPTVPIAARMEQAATPGEIYLTGSTQSLAAGRLVTEALGPLAVKGVSEPLPVFVLHRIRSPEEATVAVARTGFVGRDLELAQFQSMLSVCIEHGHGQTICIRGEPGIGKTRLVEEFARIATQSGASVHRGLVLPFGVGTGQDAVRSLVRALLGIASGSSKEDRSRAADAAVENALIDSDQRIHLNDLLNLDQPMAFRALYDAMDNDARNEGRQAVLAGLVTVLSDSQPMLLVIEDAHWADDMTLAHLASLAKVVADSPALLVVTSRIDGDPLNRSWRGRIEGRPFVTIDLGPLRRKESLRLIGEFIDSSDPIARSCMERAAGNPLFLEQLLRAAREGSSADLPDSIQSLVLARIDRLAPADKRALQAASVIGQRFDLSSLKHVLDDEDYSCAALVDHSLVCSDGVDYLFGHALIQESVYGSLLKSQRRELHRRAAAWYAPRDSVLYAEHLEHAGDEEAAGAYLTAAREQAENYRFERALDLVSRGIGVATEHDRFDLHCLKGELLLSLGRTSESTAVYQHAIETASSDVAQCRALLGLAEGLRIAEEHVSLLDALDRAEAIARRQELLEEMAKINQLRGGVRFVRGEIESGSQANVTALEYARKAGSFEIEARALSGIADADYARGRMRSANRHFRQCVDLCEKHGFGRLVPANLAMVAHTQTYLGEVHGALENFRRAREMAARTRQVRAELVALGIALFIIDMGNVAEGEELLKARLDLSRRYGMRIFECSSLMVLSLIAHQQGRFREARELFAAARDFIRESESCRRFVGASAFGILARLSDDLEERRAALKNGEELLASGSISHSYFWFYRDAIDASLESEDWDEADRYARALADYTSAEPLPWSDFYIARGRALACFGRGDRGRETLRELERLRDAATGLGQQSAIPAVERALAIP